MPKIIINEIDNTTSTLGEYQNFTVVVPGFINPNITKNGFDDNGVIELKTMSEFEEYVGKVASKTISTSAIAPVLSEISYPDDPEDPEHASTPSIYTTVPKTIFETSEYTNHLFIATEQPEESEKTGYLKGKFSLPEEVANTWYTFTLATEWEEGVKYVYIKLGEEGEDASKYEWQGNHITYELIRLGYTVLYKKLEPMTVIRNNAPKTFEGVEVMTLPEFWSCLKDKSTYDFRYITTGGYANVYAYEQIAKVASFRKGEDVLEPEIPDSGDIENAPGRGDCCALIDFPEYDDDDEYNLSKHKNNQSDLIKTVRKLGNKMFGVEKKYINEYSKFFVPNVIYKLEKDDVYNPYTNNVALPCSFHYLACAAKALQNFREWFAVSGYDRGICDLDVIGTTLIFGDLAATALQPRLGYDTKKYKDTFNKAINVVTKIRGTYYLWGNRTAHTIKETGLIASDFANIRELCTSIKKVVWLTCKQLTFSPNSDLLWINFCSKIRPLLETMKANEGIRDYAFVKVPTDKKAVMLGKIRIVPIEAVEDFEIDLFLEDSINGQVVEVTEE